MFQTGLSALGGKRTLRTSLARPVSTLCATGNVHLPAIEVNELFIRDTAEFTIGDLGHDTLLACDVDEALSHLTSSRRIDALFVDLRLSATALAGYEIANEAIRLRPGLPVLYTSGTPLTDDMTGHFVSGGHFLQKPYSPAQLESSIGTLLRSEP